MICRKVDDLFLVGYFLFFQLSFQLDYVFDLSQCFSHLLELAELGDWEFGGRSGSDPYSGGTQDGTFRCLLI